ncbi:type VI secretion system lipoprotein TssJ [Pseudomonas sp. SCB32]|uniref:type VI secretion system lipoprotein TssJ n=1 Tax=Pseudomonas sp. SCB32 TaxID=2653853 RepID=UPI001264F02A|nr:type VI secretion system lipoprotein TssJ [Pseudomonas sp. SCB32]
MNRISPPLRHSLLLALFSLSGCSWWPLGKDTPAAVEPPGSVTYHITFKVDEDINRDGSGRAMPVLLNVFELRSAGNFEMSDYFDLRDNAHARLGADFLRGDQLMIWPGATERRSYTSTSEPALIGVVAGYQQLEGRTWRLLVPLQASAFAQTAQTAEQLTPELPVPPELDEIPPAQAPLPGLQLTIAIRQDGLHIQPTTPAPSRTTP